MCKRLVTTFAIAVKERWHQVSIEMLDNFNVSLVIHLSKKTNTFTAPPATSSQSALHQRKSEGNTDRLVESEHPLEQHNFPHIAALQ
jgi:hypothetical protein